MPHKDPEAKKRYMKEWKARNPDRLLAYRARIDPDSRREYMKAYHASHEVPRETRRNRKLKSRFGITLSQYMMMLAAQKGGCAICTRVNPDGRHLFVDHDHATGRVRGLLCIICNRLVAHHESGLAVKIDRYLADTLVPPY